MTYSNGDKYEGELNDYKREGSGIYNYSNNNTEYRGLWHNNMKNG